MASMKSWIEKDAMKILRHHYAEQEKEKAAAVAAGTASTDDRSVQPVPEVGPRTAKIVSLGTGWTAAGVNLTLGKLTSVPYPSMTITDGRHEVVAYLTSETAQSTAFFTQPALSPGCRVELEKLEFVPESTLFTPDSDYHQKANPGVAFAVAVNGPVKFLGPAPPVINLNYSKRFTKEVAYWMMLQRGEPADDFAAAAAENFDTPAADNDNQSVASGHSTDSTETIESLNSVDGRPRRERNARNRMTWEEKLEHLKSYQAEFGHCNAPPGYKRGNFALGTWVNSLRTGRDELSPERKKELKQMGFVFNLAEHNWNSNLEVLKQFKKENGHTSVPISYKDAVTGIKLGCWVYNQRQAWKNNKMKPDRKKRLEKMGFEFVCAVARKRNSNAT